jgi:hypothetical protein
VSPALTLLDGVRWRGTPIFVQPAQWRIDYPVMGVALYGLGLWALRRGTLPAPVAVRLVALAERFAYNRLVPTMDWAHAVDAAERVTPGLLAEILAGYGDRRGPGLIDEARGVLRRAFGQADVRSGELPRRS